MKYIEDIISDILDDENWNEIQAEVYEQVKSARKAGETEKLNGIRDKYGYDIYKWALDELNRQEEKIINILWSAACSGDIDTLRAYYTNGGKTNRRYFKFGIAHSLISGAFRNGQIDTVHYLQSVGETTEGIFEQEELKVLYIDDLIDAAENMIDYFDCYSYNLTTTQEEKIDNLREVLKRIRRA